MYNLPQQQLLLLLNSAGMLLRNKLATPPHPPECFFLGSQVVTARTVQVFGEEGAGGGGERERN